MRDEPAPIHALPHVLLGELDHELVEGIMTTMEEDDRARFWRDHVDILGTAFLERGIAQEVVEANLADHFRQVRRLHAARAQSARRKAAYRINFDAPPPLGTMVTVGRKVATLVRVDPITRKKDGRSSWMLTWSVNGKLATSGLRSNGIIWKR